MLNRRLPFTVGLALALAAGATAALPKPGLAASTTFVVNKIGDAADNNLADAKCDTSANTGKQCTLRAAIQEANDTAGADTINFNITSASKVITPASPLPPITERLIIDGYSQSGAAENTLLVGNNAVLKIVLDGVNAGASANGLELQTAESVIKGLVIQHFYNGIRVSGGGSAGGVSNILRGNFIGTNAAGTIARANTQGVFVVRPHTLIGGFDPASRNVISGNSSGVFVSAGIGFTTVKGNYIGTNASGTSGLGNASGGVTISAANVALIGGTTVAERNVISANGIGITLSSHANGSNIVKGNYIGTKADGTGDLGNHYGIIIGGSNNNTVGGSSGGTGNLISGNDTGIWLELGASGNQIKGNTIKASRDDGILAESGPNTIGGGNQIYSNGLDGIRIQSPGSGINVTGQPDIRQRRAGHQPCRRHGGCLRHDGQRQRRSRPRRQPSPELSGARVRAAEHQRAADRCARDSQQQAQHDVPDRHLRGGGRRLRPRRGPDPARQPGHHDQLRRRQELLVQHQRDPGRPGGHSDSDRT